MMTSAERAAGEFLLQPFDGRQVEMVGRLVQQQDVGRGRQHPRQRRATRLAAGEMRGVLLAGEAELLQQIARGMAVVGRSKAGFDIGERRCGGAEIRLLRQVAHGRARLDEARAAVLFDQAGGDLQQRRLAGTVAADEADALAGRHAEFGDVSSGVPPNVSAISFSWISGGAIVSLAARACMRRMA